MPNVPDEFEPYSGDYSGYVDEPADPWAWREIILFAVLCCATGVGVGALWLTVRDSVLAWVRG